MKAVLRYRTAKPDDGHFSFQLDPSGIVVALVEYWHTEKGWEVFLDVLEDSRQSKDRRYFFLFNQGDDISFVGDHPEDYFVARNEAKAYVSYVIETTHLSETQRQLGKIEKHRYMRKPPTMTEMGTAQRQHLRRDHARVQAE